MRRAARTDANLTSVVNAFRKLGCSVHVTNGAWDLTVGYKKVVALVEVKDGAKPPSARKFTKAQNDLPSALGIRVVQNLDDVEKVVATLRRWHTALRNSIWIEAYPRSPEEIEALPFA